MIATNINARLAQKTWVTLLLSLLMYIPGVFAVQYKLDNGTVSFTLPAPIGQLLAVNQKVSGFMETKNGIMHFNVPVAEFRFVTAAMPDYINASTTKRFKQYYLNTDEFPQASFKGKITDLDKVDFAKDGTYEVNVKGMMTIHGTTQEISKSATIIVNAGKVALKSVFDLQLKDYEVRVPEPLGTTFFNEVSILVDWQLKP